MHPAPLVSLSRTAASLRILMLLLLVASASLASAFAGPGSGPPSPGNYPNQVGPGLYALDGVDADLPYGDLPPLARVVGNARLVGLGESIHTSGGFYDMKHRLIRYLVEERGFRVLAFEEGFFHAERAAGFLEDGVGTVDDALQAIGAVWRSEEVRDLLAWIAAWNREHPDDKVRFYGYDMQFEAREQADALFAFLGRLGFAADHPWILDVGLCDWVDQRYTPFRPYPEENETRCQAALAAIDAFFIENERAIVAATSEDDLAWGRLHLFGQREWQDFIHTYYDDEIAGDNIRDAAMAHYLIEVRRLRYGNARTIVWAHNLHVLRDGEVGWEGVRSLGTWLDQAFGAKYVAIGLVAHETYGNEGSGYCGLAEFGIANPVEEALYQLAEGDLLVDLDPRGAHPAFLSPGEEYGVGQVSLVPARHYDALVYLDVSPARHTLFWPHGPCHT